MDLLTIVIVIVISTAINLLLNKYLPAYFLEKGKNLATKEDIEPITSKIESIKTDYAKVIEDIRSNNQLKLAEIERERNIRKEVYLQAVEALTRTVNVVVSLSNLNINEQDFTKQMNNDSGLIAKIQIVGSESTVKSITIIMGLVGTVILELFLERSSLIQRKMYIDLLNNFSSKSQGEIERYISIMKNINLEGNKDPHIWKIVNDNVEFESKQRDKYQEEINNLWEMQNKEHLLFTQKCMDKFFTISLLMPDLVLSIREDLNLPISNEAYLDIFNNNIELSKNMFVEFYEKVSKTLV